VKPTAVLVDIDGILYDSNELFCRLFAERGIAITAAEHIREWDFFRPYMSGREFGELITTRMHHPDTITGVTPFPNAARAISGWKRSGAAIHIVSDRAESATGPTATWLAKSGIPFDFLVCGPAIDKVAYAKDHGIDLVVDDKPDMITRTAAAGIRIATLRWPYNTEAATAAKAIVADDWAGLRWLIANA
jgi:phosphoglycolate phosphatase-like HAD superfamily hydrolase